MMEKRKTAIRFQQRRTLRLPDHGQVRASNKLRKQGIFVSPSEVRSIWPRHDLASMKQRLAALEKMSAEQGLVLTEAQVRALEHKSRMMRHLAR